jgi:electron transfer flavoprotein alpha subunit
MNTTLITHAMDFKIDDKGRGLAVRPISNGYLFERLHIAMNPCPIICFKPSVLTNPEPDCSTEMETTHIRIDPSSYNVKTRLINTIRADPGELDIEEADIVVSGGRGVGKGEAFGGTRPVIDWHVLPFERQIGQTGKQVTPRLIFVCGISGANEFTAGMEKSQFVIAINMDQNARIFRLADLGVIGDVHEVVPRLIERINEIKASRKSTG